MTSPRSAWLVFLALGIMLAASLVAEHAAAQPPGRPPTAQQPSQGSFLQQRLGLTDEQMNSIQEIYRREAQTGSESRPALRKAENDLRELVLIGADDAKIQAKTTEVKTLLGNTVDNKLKTLREIGAVLTPEQRETFAKLGEPVLSETRSPQGEMPQPQGEVRPPRRRPEGGPRY